MITLNLNVKGTLEHVQIRDEVLFNSALAINPKIIVKLIKSIHPLYKISKDFFEIVNTYVDFTKNGVSLYAGLIVRTGLDDYAVLYLEGSTIDEEYLISVLDEFIHDIGDYKPKEINVDKFEISRAIFMNIIKNM